MGAPNPYAVRNTRRITTGLVQTGLTETRSKFYLRHEPTMAMETPWADEKSPPIVGSAAASSSYDDSGPCIFSDHRAPSVKNIARPGCSNEVLNTALRCMSLLATTLSTTSQKKFERHFERHPP
ncbi:hypothetical protein Hanom_Chr00s000003g01602581 [Helianthus anomalus]